LQSKTDDGAAEVNDFDGAVEVNDFTMRHHSLTANSGLPYLWPLERWCPSILTPQYQDPLLAHTSLFNILRPPHQMVGSPIFSLGEKGIFGADIWTDASAYWYYKPTFLHTEESRPTSQLLLFRC
jgi:hypothetical protein